MQKNPTVKNGLLQCRIALKYKATGAFEKAIQTLQNIISDVRKKENSFDEVHLIAIVQENLAITYIEMDEDEEALYYFEKALLNLNMILKNNPNMTLLYEDQAFILIDMGLIYRNLKKYDKAVKCSKKAIKLYRSSNCAEKDKIYALKSEIFLIKAEVADREKMDRKKTIKAIRLAIKYIDLALEIIPDMFEYKKDKTLAQILLSDNYSQNHDTIHEALKLLKEAVKTFSQLLLERNDDEQIILSLANSKAHIGQIYRDFGEIYLALIYFEEAISDYQNYLEHEPLNYEVLNNLGINLNNMANIYISTQKKEEVPTLLNHAIEYYTMALKDDRDKESDNNKFIIDEIIYHKAIAQIDLSRFHIELGEIKQAKNLLNKSIADSTLAILKDSSNINFLNQKALANTVHADINEIEGNHLKAIEGYKKAIALFDDALEIKPNDLFSINHRGLAKGDIVTSCIELDKKEEGDFWFAEAMKDYDYGITLSPTFTDMVINRATLLSSWAYANKYSVEQNELLELLEGAMYDFDVILKENPYHFSAMNNKLTLSSDIAGIYKERGESKKVLEMYYNEIENYKIFLETYNNDLMSFMNSGVSKLLLSKELVEQNRSIEALLFLKSSLNDYNTVLKSDPTDMETLRNKSLSLREIIDIETSSGNLQNSIELNKKMLEQYDNYFDGIEKEKDSHMLTYNMTFPLQSLIYAHYRSKYIDVNEIVSSLEITKSKTLKMVMGQTIEKSNLNPIDRDNFIEIQKKQQRLQKNLKDLKIKVKEEEKSYNEIKRLKSVPKAEIKNLKTTLNQSLKQREELYEELHYYNKEFSKLLQFNEKPFDMKTVEKLDKKSVVLYPIYDADRSELQVVALYKENNHIKVTIKHKMLKENPKFYNFVLLIKDVEEFFGLKKEKDREKKIKALNGKYGKMSRVILEMIFKLDENFKIIALKIDFNQLINNHRYKILNFALNYLSQTIINSIPKGKTKIYFSPFGDLNMLPLHAIQINEDEFLIDNHEIVYIPSLAIWSDLSQNIVESGALSLKNLYFSKDHHNETFCYDEITTCQNILEGEHKNNIDTLEFKKEIDSQKLNILHLSVHGNSDLKNPLNSGLNFKESQLSILEIQALKIQANIVILSACESNLTKAEGADELLAFERAFLIAGANNVISTFDSVEAEQTESFMKHFYQEVKSGVSLSYAFQQSAIEAIDSESNEWKLFRFTGF